MSLKISVAGASANVMQSLCFPDFPGIPPVLPQVDQLHRAQRAAESDLFHKGFLIILCFSFGEFCHD